MFFTLLAEWHAGVELGGAMRVDGDSPFFHSAANTSEKDKNLFYHMFVSTTLGAEAGYRFFIKDHHWFINPVFHISTLALVLPSFQGECRFGKVFFKKISLYGIGGAGLTIPFAGNSVLGVGASWRVKEKWSLTVRAVHKFYFSADTKDANRLFITAGVEFHSPHFYHDKFDEIKEKEEAAILVSNSETSAPILLS